MSEAEAIKSFLSSFGLEAYDESEILYEHKKINPPYITYSWDCAGESAEIPLTASVWYRGVEYRCRLLETVKLISESIGWCGTVIPCSGGGVLIRRAEPFTKRLKIKNDGEMQGLAVNLTAEVFM